ncbi:MAG: hypothetical protein ACKO3N_15775, partial [Verrucomicrobiota bacterium]
MKFASPAGRRRSPAGSSRLTARVIARVIAWMVAAGWFFAMSPRLAAADAGSGVGPVPEALRREFSLAPFYQKVLRVGPFPVVGSARVSDPALREAAWIVTRMLEGRDDLLDALASTRTRLAVMAWNEFTTDVPEHASLQPRLFWDRRARGLGATPEAPAVSCAEENLLGYPGDPYATENILVHEFAHAIHEMGLARLDPTFDGRLQAAHAAATNRGRWRGTYAATSRQEYWAEGVQCWFDDNRENDALHNHVNTRAELLQYDPALAGLCREVFGDVRFRYTPARSRLTGHLA